MGSHEAPEPSVERMLRRNRMTRSIRNNRPYRRAVA